MQTTDWFRVITQLMQAGIPMRKIGEEMGGVQITARMLGHYRAGTEPLHWRGECLLTFWSAVTSQPKEARPMRDIIGKYRAGIVVVRPSHISMQPAAGEAPQAKPPSAAQDPMPPIKRKPGRPPGARLQPAAD